MKENANHKAVEQLHKSTKQADQQSGKASVEELLADALDTFMERGSAYGKCYVEHGSVMQALFPNGIFLESDDDFVQFGLFNMMVSKMTRLSNAMRRGEVHTDSAHDLGVYSFMMEEVQHNRPESELE